MKIPSVLQNLLTNKIVLNVVCILSALNLIGYLAMGKITAILFFIVLAILITQFNKNMIIVLGVPLILVNLFVAKGYSFVEGMETNSDTTTKSSGTSDTPAMTQDQKDALKSVAKQAAQDKKSGQGLPITPIDPSLSQDTTNTSEPFGVNQADKKRSSGHSIDYATTVEEAYDNLNSILGGEGIQKLTADSQKLMKQQMQLAASLKNIEPMVESLAPMMKQAQDMMNGIGGNDGMGNIMDMAKKMGLGGATKKEPKYDKALYTANKKSDRDGDGIACEK